MSSDAYRRAGVDIDAADSVISRIKALTNATTRDGVLSEIGGFGGLFKVSERYRDPVLVSGADGVGTKILLAQRLGIHDTVGIDLVAMNVNDVVVSGAEPLFFLDYFATGKLEPDVAVAVIQGISDGCKQANCALIGGEISEMPGMYAPGHYDLAGFCVGAVERDGIIDGKRIAPGDRLVGLPSSGVHSNGYSLVRKICDPLGYDAEHGLGRSLGEVLLAPTVIYVRRCLELCARFDVKGFVHVTGGGFVENIPRVLPDDTSAEIRWGAWNVPPVFTFLQERGELPDDEMVRVFNNGIGMIVVVSADEAAEVAQTAGGVVMGEIVPRGDAPVVILR
jgi:phosphoribosylformylglycinamidine cyclo-ligase